MWAKSQGTASIHLFFQSFFCVWFGSTDVTSKLDKGAKIVIGCQSGGTMKPTPNLADGQQSRLALNFTYPWISLHGLGLKIIWFTEVKSITQVIGELVFQCYQLELGRESTENSSIMSMEP